MEIGSIFLILGLLILVVLFISRPLVERTATVVSQEEHELSSLLAERDRLLTALQELDFDYTLGKIPEEDYAPMRLALMQKGAAVLRKLDAFGDEEPGSEAEDRIEAAVAARRADAARRLSPAAGSGNNHPVQGAAGVAEADDDLEVLLANRRRLRSEKSAGFCPKCGGPVQKSDRFCPKCGATLS